MALDAGVLRLALLAGSVTIVSVGVLHVTSDGAACERQWSRYKADAESQLDARSDQEVLLAVRITRKDDFLRECLDPRSG